MIQIFKPANIVLILILVISNSFLYSEENTPGISPEDYEKKLLLNSENITEIQLHENLIQAAEIRQITGDLSGASELFKKASLTVKGKKDFTSLYRAAVLNVEMAYHRAAEADLRAIIMFSDDSSLRIKASLLTARLKALQGYVEEAQSILLNVFQSSELPEEAGIWAEDFYEKNKDEFDMTELGLILENNKDKFLNAAADLKALITPELIFGSGDKIDKKDIEPVIVEKQPGISIINSTVGTTVSAAIQLGSFSKRDNAEDLVKSVSNIGYAAVIKIKTVNEKNYFAVTIPVKESQDIQNLIIELKEKGFEGYPVY